jgi:hypothetical protein
MDRFDNKLFTSRFGRLNLCYQLKYPGSNRCLGIINAIIFNYLVDKKTNNFKPVKLLIIFQFIIFTDN